MSTWRGWSVLTWLNGSLADSKPIESPSEVHESPSKTHDLPSAQSCGVINIGVCVRGAEGRDDLGGRMYVLEDQDAIVMPLERLAGALRESMVGE